MAGGYCHATRRQLTVRAQLFGAFTIIVILAIGVTIAICVGFTSILGSTSYNSAESSIKHQMHQNTLTESKEIAASIERQLLALSESTSIATSLYAAVVMNETIFDESSYNFLLKPSEYFREYEFRSQCSYPACPTDYGDLNGRSRVTNLEGSITHSSVYLFDSRTGIAAQNDSAFNGYINRYPYVLPAIDSIGVVDTTLSTWYNSGPKSSLFFYLSVRLGDEDDYIAVHRVFPGTARNSSVYDPSNRGWFRRAPLDAQYMEGPYKETFTGKLVINLSSRKDVSRNAAHPYPTGTTVVAAAVVLLSDLQDIVNGTIYPSGGFGALLKYSTLEVLSWKEGQTGRYNDSTESFLTVNDVDPQLAKHDLRKEGTFEYTDADGVRWIVASYPFFSASSYGSGSAYDQLVLLVFANSDIAMEPLSSLDSNINSTESTMSTLIFILCGAVAFVLLVGLWLFIRWFTFPLERIRQIAEEVIRITTEEEEKRDYAAVLSSDWFGLSRRDEVGSLVANFWRLISRLHEENDTKKRRPKHPSNPFHAIGESMHDSLVLAPGEEGSLNAEYLLSVFDPALPTTPEGHLLTHPDASAPAEPMDVLSRIANETAVVADLSRSTAAKDVEMAIIQPASAAKSGNTKYAMVPSSDSKSSDFYTKTRLFSLRGYLLALACVLIGAIIGIMILTIILLNSEGYGWMTETGDSILKQELINLNVITDAKAIFTKVLA
jgi:hypothetical protein